MKFIGTINFAITIFGIFACNGAIAANFVDANESTPKVVDISKKEMTRISVEGGYITNFKVIEGEADIQTDQTTGEVFLIPMVNKPINAFITSEKGKKYLLTLVPKASVTADSVIIREDQLEQAKLLSKQQIEQNERERLQRNAQSYSTAVQQFINDMLSNSERSNLDCSVAGEEVPLWKEAMLIRKQRCSSANLQGQVFNLTNISNSLMVMQEQEFYKKNVIAVAIRKLQLLPGEQTDIYVVFGDE